MTPEKLRNFEPLFGQWIIDGKISQGKNFNLFRVSRKTEAGTDYLAVKTIRFPESETEFQRAMASSLYESEADYLNALEARLRQNTEKMLSLRRSRSIVHFDDYMIVRENHCLYAVILMELLMPLSEYFSRRSVTQKDIAKLGCDISEALSDFRLCGIVHKAVRPENIFVTGNGTYKLGDFGIDSDPSRQDATDFSDYYPPECQYGSTFSNTLDVYSLGMVLYKFMNRNRMPFLPPFPGNISPEDRQRAFEMRLSGEEIPAPELADDTFSKIILKAASFTPERRYRAPEFLQNDLSRYLSGDTVEAPDKAYTEPVKEEAAEEISEYQEAFRDDEEDDARDNKNRLYTIIGIVAAVLVCLAILVTSLGRRNASEEPTLPDITTTRPLITKQTEAETTTEEVTTTEAETTTEEETTTAEETTTEAETTIEETTTLAETTTETETTTEEITTTEAPTTPYEEPTTVPGSDEELILYRQTGNVSGELDSEGREYSELSGLSAKTETQGDSISRVVLTAENFGTNPYKNSDAFICQVMDGTVILKEAISYECSYDESDPDGEVEIIISFSGSIYVDEMSDFYIVFEDGAIASDEYSSLGTQIKI